MIHRLAPFLIVLAGLGACATPPRGPVLAGPEPYGEGTPIAKAGLWLDPVPLPPDVRPGECLVRDFVAPGTYRWERIDCGRHADAGPPVVVYAEPRVYERTWVASGYGYGAYDQGQGYVQGDLQAYGVDGAYTSYDTSGRFGYGQAYQGYGDAYGWDDGYGGGYPRYRAAGRDANGFLVWPGKRP